MNFLLSKSTLTYRAVYVRMCCVYEDEKDCPSAKYMENHHENECFGEQRDKINKHFSPSTFEGPHSIQKLMHYV